MGLWRELERYPPEQLGLGEPPPTALQGTYFEWLALVYRNCAVNFGWTPQQVDQMEVWEAGAALGVASADLEDWQQEYARLEAEMLSDESNPTPVSRGVKSFGNDVLAQRVAASKGEGPAPEAKVMNQAQLSNVMRTLRGN